jgi:eukaryotic translation initiation factor 2C
MLIGMNMSHPAKSEKGSSIAAIVGSLDGCAGQYASFLCVQEQRKDIQTNLKGAVEKLYRTFAGKNNGHLPKHVIIYRDGISESQYGAVVEEEVSMFKEALEDAGALNVNKDHRVTLLVCTKRHPSRFVYNGGSKDQPNFQNCCPGVCIDGSSDKDGVDSITHGQLNEFYLNSHSVIQGTGKSTKYTLLYDEIGFKLAEIELLTYWSTYLYARCNRSVGQAAPLYYAFWAATRGRLLSQTQQVTQLQERLDDISQMWVKEENTMLFI